MLIDIKQKLNNNLPKLQLQNTLISDIKNIGSHDFLLKNIKYDDLTLNQVEMYCSSKYADCMYSSEESNMVMYETIFN